MRELSLALAAALLVAGADRPAGAGLIAVVFQLAPLPGRTACVEFASTPVSSHPNDCFGSGIMLLPSAGGGLTTGTGAIAHLGLFQTLDFSLSGETVTGHVTIDLQPAPVMVGPRLPPPGSRPVHMGPVGVVGASCRPDTCNCMPPDCVLPSTFQRTMTLDISGKAHSSTLVISLFGSLGTIFGLDAAFAFQGREIFREVIPEPAAGGLLGLAAFAALGWLGARRL